MIVLVTGGAGYIGSAIVHVLADHGHVPIILDSLVGGDPSMVEGFRLYRASVGDKPALLQVFDENPGISAAIHCAALTSVPESEQLPLRYYRNNVAESIAMFEVLVDRGIRGVVYSSSASVYGSAGESPISEDSPVSPESAYASSKLMVERIMADTCKRHRLPGLSLRYFNPIGADPRLRYGPWNRESSALLSRLLDAAETGNEFVICGDDYSTRDGTGIRDYVHIEDLAFAHVQALECLESVRDDGSSFHRIVNLGSGSGATVIEFLSTFEEVLGRRVRQRVGPRRPGDVAGGYASCNLASELLDWHPQKPLSEGIRDALRWSLVRAGVSPGEC